MHWQRKLSARCVFIGRFTSGQRAFDLHARASVKRVLSGEICNRMRLDPSTASTGIVHRRALLLLGRSSWSKVALKRFFQSPMILNYYKNSQSLDKGRCWLRSCKHICETTYFISQIAKLGSGWQGFEAARYEYIVLNRLFQYKIFTIIFYTTSKLRSSTLRNGNYKILI